ADTSNWIGHAVGGAILACLALSDGTNDPELTTYFGGLLLKLENHLAASYLPDGFTEVGDVERADHVSSNSADGVAVDNAG
ncbi:hypothetical protein B4Q13_22750, partial [Lacticaseibacillus rhamnosus]